MVKKKSQLLKSGEENSLAEKGNHHPRAVVGNASRVLVDLHFSLREGEHGFEREVDRFSGLFRDLVSRQKEGVIHALTFTETTDADRIVRMRLFYGQFEDFGKD